MFRALFGAKRPIHSGPSSEDLEPLSCLGRTMMFLPAGPYYVYQTHWNGGRVFRVHVHAERRLAFASCIEATSRRVAACPPFLDSLFSFEGLWIGTSEKNDLTSSGGGYGPRFDGNTLLFHVISRDHGSMYVYFGSALKCFRSREPIVHFTSPVANNDVPCPFARTSVGTYYLLETDEVVRLPAGVEASPYEICYGPARPEGTRRSPLPLLFKYVP